MGACKINSECSHWNDGAGDRVCYQCKELNRQASNGHDTQPFYTDNELISNARENTKVTSIFQVIRNFHSRDRIIVEDNLLFGISPSELAREYNLSRQQIHRIIWQGKHDIKLHLGLSTVF
jgi:hypothetical protein